MANKPIPNKLITTLITILTTLSLLLVTTSPVNATTTTQITDRPIQGVVITDPEAQELIKELEQYGFTKTIQGNSTTETITFTHNKLTITLTKHNNTSPIQSRNETDRWVIGTPGLFYGTDPWGFYIKLEWPAQLLVAAGTLIGPGLAIKIALTALLKIFLKSSTKIAVGVSAGFFAGSSLVRPNIEALDTLLDSMSVCPFPQPRYIRFDPFRTKCN